MNTAESMAEEREESEQGGGQAGNVESRINGRDSADSYGGSQGKCFDREGRRIELVP